MAKVIGGFYYRPMDQVLHRLTDLPSKSQPVGYIHLAIIRETSISHRQTHYRYFTYDAHQGLVKKGLASDPWEIKPKIKIKGVKSGSGTADQVPIAELDENGFPLPDISRLLHGTGAATLKDIQTAITAKEKVETYTNQCSIKVGPDGKEHIDWKNVGYGHGRPRKYEKGKEPYLAARRRREELGLPPPKRGRPKGRKDSIKRASKKRDSTQSAPPEAEALKIQEVPHEESQHNNTWTPSTETPAQGASGLAATPAPKRRGRPPKNIQTETPVAADTPSLPTATPIPKKRGRPAKSATAAPAAPTLIPHTEAAEEPPSVAVTTPAPKRRGRPPKNPPPQTPIATIQIPETPITAPTTRSTAKRKAAATPTPVATRQSKRARTITDFFTPVSRASGFIAVNTVETQEPSTKDVPESRDLSKPTETPKLDQTPVAPRKRTAEKTPTKSQHKKRKRGDDPPPEPVLESAQQTQQPPEVEPARNVPPQDQETMQQGSTKELDIPGATMQDVQAEAATSEQNKDHTVSAPVTSETSQTSEVPPLTHEVEGTTLEVEPVEPLEKNAYNLMGGMLALSRQQVVLDLIKEHGGCFPGGLELRHAFNKRYKMKNPKAGDSDRRLVRSVIQSLQYKGKVNQITFTFMNSKQVPCTKKILVDAELSLDNPTVEKMTRDIIAADGNMWYPPGTDLPADIVERMAQPSGRMQASTQVMVEGVQFDRLYPAPIELLKKKRAERAAQRAKQKTDRHEERLKARQERALRKALTAQRTNASAPAFTEEQKAEAAKRKAALKQQTAMYKLNKRFSSRVIAGEQEYGGDSSLPKSIWWNEFVTRHDDTESFLRGVKDVRKWENLITEAGGIDDLTEGVRGQDKLVMINHFGPQVEGQVTQGSVDLDLPPNLSQRAAKRLLKMPALNEEVPKTTRKKRRPKGPSRRSMAMKAIHDQISLELADDGVDCKYHLTRLTDKN